MVELIQNFRLRLLYQLLPYSGDGLPLGAWSAELTNLSLSFHAYFTPNCPVFNSHIWQLPCIGQSHYVYSSYCLYSTPR